MKPDTRPDWRDPNLPVIRDYRMPNGERKIEVEADYERRYRQHLLDVGAYPDFRNDPTYDLRRRR